MNRIVSLFSLLMLVWLLLSGIYTPWLISLGVLSCVVVVLIALRMDVIDNEGHPFHLHFGSLCLYWCWLLVEILKSNYIVLRCILSPGMPISPNVLALRSTQRSDLGRVIYANSITLTPGTVSIEVDGDITEVHALTQAAADDLRDGEMDRRVTAVEMR